MRWSQATETGLVRRQNEDCLCVIPDLALFAVADGMGGHLAGEVASRMAVESVARQLQSGNRDDTVKSLLEGVRRANSDIYKASRRDGSCRGMGTTLTVAVISGGDLVLAHVGDSRAYIIRGDKIHLLTEDHSLVQEMIRHGGITREQARDHPHRNVLTRALGTEPLVDVDLISIKLERGDILLLCTDGLYGLVGDEEILELVRSAANPDQAVRMLVDEALRRGGSDNISVIVVEVDD
ncbi:MAG: Stp1/IreP family PP2C-type Ser/Thr phosphatase [Peptococcaceae bacterium]|nr:Stp1/IreP family PP2C-type Ser/Thr phosphatase [Peptococcaceae bacterium]